MVVLGGGAVLCERGTPVSFLTCGVVPLVKYSQVDVPDVWYKPESQKRSGCVVHSRNSKAKPKAQPVECGLDAWYKPETRERKPSSVKPESVMRRAPALPRSKADSRVEAVECGPALPRVDTHAPPSPLRKPSSYRSSKVLEPYAK